MINFCGCSFQVGMQSIHLYPISVDIWDMQACTVCIDLGRVLPYDHRLKGITLLPDQNSTDPDSLPGNVKCYAKQADDIRHIIQGTPKEFKAFAKKYGGVAIKSLAHDGSWIIKGVARLMVADLS